MSRPRALDALDRALVVALENDGRRPFRDIARDLGVPEATVRSRVKRLIDERWIHVTAVGDPLALGIQVAAITLLRLRPGTVLEAAEMLAAYPHVRFVGSTFGSADLIIQTLHKDIASLHAFVTVDLPQRLTGLVSTETFQLAQVHKSSWTWSAWFDAQGASAEAGADAGTTAARAQRGVSAKPTE